MLSSLTLLFCYFFVVMLATINGKQQIGDKAGKNPYHEAILATGNQVIDLEVTLAPGKEFLDVPSEFMDEGSLL